MVTASVLYADDVQVRPLPPSQEERMASGTSRRKMRCETGKCCCRPDHKNVCSPRAAGKRKLAKEIKEAADERHARTE